MAAKRVAKRRVKLTEPKHGRNDPSLVYDPRQGLLFPADTPEGRACEWELQFHDDPQTPTDIFKNYALTFEKGMDFLVRMEWRGYVRKEEALRQCKRLREIIRTPTELYLIEEGRMIQAWVFAENTWKLCAEKKEDGSFADHGTHPETP